MLQRMKEQSKRWRLLLSDQSGVQNSDQLCRVLGTENEQNQLYLERSMSTSRTAALFHLNQMISMV